MRVFTAQARTSALDRPPLCRALVCARVRPCVCCPCAHTAHKWRHMPRASFVTPPSILGDEFSRRSRQGHVDSRQSPRPHWGGPKRVGPTGDEGTRRTLVHVPMPFDAHAAPCPYAHMPTCAHMPTWPHSHYTHAHIHAHIPMHMHMDALLPHVWGGAGTCGCEEDDLMMTPQGQTYALTLTLTLSPDPNPTLATDEEEARAGADTQRCW